MNLLTPSLALRDFRMDDLEALTEYNNHAEVHRYESEHIPDQAANQAYLEHVVRWAGEDPRTTYALAVTLQDSQASSFAPDTPVGRVSLTLLSPRIRLWEIGWTIHPRLWGRGYATEAAGGLLRFAFHSLGAHRVVAFCNVNNRASVRVMQKLGLRCEGRLREERYWNGAWCDEFVYAILDQEFSQPASAFPQGREAPEGCEET
ncbi:MAG: GNAT family N-acetyltransferase [Chloroflexota bacterium]